MLQQSLVDGAEMVFGQVPVVDELPVDPRQGVDRLTKMRIPDGVLLQERVPLRVEEPAIEGRDLERRVALVDDLKEGLQSRPEQGAGRKQAPLPREVAGDLVRDGGEAVRLAVHRALAQRKQFAGFGVEDEEQPVEDDQRVVINRLERGGVRLESVGRVVEKALGEMSQRLKHLRLERVADPTGIVGAGLEERGHAERLGVERRTVEKGIKVEERRDVVGLQQRRQIHLVVAIELVGGVAVVESPEAPVGQDAPIQAAMLNVEGDLERRVPVRKWIAAAGVQRHVERAVPVLGVADGEGFAVEEGIGEDLSLVGVEPGLIPVKGVIRLLRPGRGYQRRLYLERMAERREHRAHQILLGLRFNAAGREVGEDRGDLRHDRSRGGRQPLPISSLREDDVEIVIREKLLVTMRLADERELGYGHQ